MAKDFQKSLENADNSTIIAMIEEVCNQMQASQFKKPETKHKVEVMLRNKRPQVNNITRDAYRKLCLYARCCTSCNSAMLKLIASFEKTNAITV